MARRHRQLPEDLLDIAQRLSMARETLSAIESDELRQRVQRAVQLAPGSQRRSVATVPMGLIAAPLTVSLVLASGVGVALAGGSQNGGSQGGDGNAGNCQYNGSWTKSYSWWVTKKWELQESLTWNGKDLTAYISYTEPSWSYKWGSGSTYNIKGTSYTATAPYKTPSLTVNANGAPYTVSITW